MTQDQQSKGSMTGGGVFTSQTSTALSVALALAVVGSVAMMIVPLPTWLLDLLLTANISVAAVLLVVSLYIPNVMALSSLPSLLLLTTLLRLALNVSTTRLILLNADAGRVIEAFGEFVVQGSVVVGAIVFLIVTLIQFVVVAQGSERVAEVAARFSLDAMPGRQMAIDADLRSGALGLLQAQRARVELQNESQLYGAMDGAMKFVKGDAVAGVVITVINIVGGLSIGVFQKDMALVDAAQTYALLTIGDGLVSQIPALLVATAAGIAVTRVSSRGEDLGPQIAAQVVARPKALLLAAGLLLALGLVPGLPWWPFVLVACALGAVAFWAKRADLGKVSEQGLEAQWSRLVLEVGSEVGLSEASFKASWEARARLVEAETGVALPELLLASRLEPEGFVCLVDGIPACQGDVESPEALLETLEAAARRHRSTFLGFQEVQVMLDGLRRHAPAVVEAAVPKVLSVPGLTAVLRALVDEGIPIKNLRGLLEAVAHAPVDLSPRQLVEAVRSGNKRLITHTLTAGEEVLEAFVVDREVEEMVRTSVRSGPKGPYLSLTPGLAAEIRAAAERVFKGRERPVVLASPDVRPYLREILVRGRPGVMVVSNMELVAELKVVPVGKVCVRDADPL